MKQPSLLRRYASHLCLFFLFFPPAMLTCVDRFRLLLLFVSRVGDDDAPIRAQASGLPGGQPVLHGRHGGGVAVHQSPPEGIQVPKSGEEFLHYSLK